MLKDKQASLEYHREYYVKLKQKCTDYLGGKCVVCGTTETLEFDHIDSSTKVFVITEKIKSKWADLVIELDKCQLLCHEHHVDKHRTAFHGSLWMYTNNGCRCDLCRASHRTYMRAYRTKIPS